MVCVYYIPPLKTQATMWKKRWKDSKSQKGWKAPGEHILWINHDTHESTEDKAESTKLTRACTRSSVHIPWLPVDVFMELVKVWMSESLFLVLSLWLFCLVWPILLCWSLFYLLIFILLYYYSLEARLFPNEKTEEGWIEMRKGGCEYNYSVR